jgi:hypothetical protein
MLIERWHSLLIKRKGGMKLISFLEGDLLDVWKRGHIVTTNYMVYVPK